MINFNKTMYGRQVRFINAEAHEELPDFYPEVGTVGLLISPEGTSFIDIVDDYVVQWPEGSTSLNDIWYCEEDYIELVDEITDYTVEKYGVVVAMKLFLVDYHIPYATLAFAFGGTVTVEWDVVENRKKYESGINSYTLVYDERVGDTSFENHVKVRR